MAFTHFTTFPRSCGQPTTVNQASPKPVNNPPEPKINENRGRKEKGNKKPEKSIVTKVKKKGKTVDYTNRKKTSSQLAN